MPEVLTKQEEGRDSELVRFQSCTPSDQKRLSNDLAHRQRRKYLAILIHYQKLSARAKLPIL
jgi:hypothetical protein